MKECLLNFKKNAFMWLRLFVAISFLCCSYFFVPSDSYATITMLIINCVSLFCFVSFRLFEYKFASNVALNIAVINPVLSVLGQNNIPEFLRAIKGEDFLEN